MTPELTFRNGDTFSFWTRSDLGLWPDRLQVRLSVAGDSVDVGETATDVGDFTTLLLDINPTYLGGGFPGTYPLVWTRYEVTLRGVPQAGTGRIAFRYFVENGGPDGSDSYAIGIDAFEYAPAPWLTLPVVLRSAS